jgi:small ligand-binding sensory domain FIST
VSTAWGLSAPCLCWASRHECFHDASLVSEKLGGLPLAGFNCAGEIGPVGGKNFLHGFTASIALFVDA